MPEQDAPVSQMSLQRGGLSRQFAALGSMQRSNQSIQYQPASIGSASEQVTLQQGVRSLDSACFGSRMSGVSDLGRQLTARLTEAMNSGPVQMSLSTPARGKEHSPLVYYLSSSFLRSGFALQSIALVLMCLFNVAFGGRRLFVFDLFSEPDVVRGSDGLRQLLSILMFLYMVGSINLAFFQVFVADNSKWTRGFRAGSKLLSCAVTLDVVASALRLVEFINSSIFLSMKWWAKYQETKSEWALYHLGSTLHSASLILYGAAFFMLESYHDKGTKEAYSWSLLALYSIAGLTEIAMLYTGVGGFFTLFLLGALFTSTVWALEFEPTLEQWSPELHSRDIDENIAPYQKDSIVPNNCSGDAVTYAAIPDRQHSSVSLTASPTFSSANYVGGLSTMPTAYDFTAMQEQLSQNTEMGSVMSYM